MTAADETDPNRLGRLAHGRPAQAPATGRADRPAKRIVVGYGFWIFMLTDIVMFSAFFAAYAVLVERDRRRPERRASSSTCDNVALETACLLLSSFTCGLASLAVAARSNLLWTSSRWRSPVSSGLAFLGARDQRVRRPGRARRGPHAQRLPVVILRAGRLPRRARDRRPAVARHDDGAGPRQGLRPDILHRILCFSLFWHALDIIWVGHFHRRLPDREPPHEPTSTDGFDDALPGDDADWRRRGAADSAALDTELRGYVVGLALAALLTAASFCVAGSTPHLRAGDPGGADRARGRPDGRPPGVLPPPHHRTGQHQQRAGARLRRADRRRW